MIIDRNEIPQELVFALTLPQLRQAHEIYKKHCFFQDFIECCEERRTEGTGLCNLPYQTLEHETDILCKAYELYEKQADINVSYHVTMENVIDQIEKRIANGELHPHTEPAPVWCWSWRTALLPPRIQTLPLFRQKSLNWTRNMIPPKSGRQFTEL